MKQFSYALMCVLLIHTANAVVTPYAHYRMGDGTPATNGGQNLPLDSSGNARHLINATTGTPAITPAGGASNDAFYSFSAANQYFWGTSGAWNPPEDHVGVEAWLRTTNLSQTGAHVFGTGNNLNGINLGYDATNNRGWFGSVSGTAFAGSNGTANYIAGTWIHLAAVRSNGITTFYVNGTAKGTTSAVPVDAGSLHMAVVSGGTKTFLGDIGEARIFTFAPGAFDPTKDLLYPAAEPDISSVVLATPFATVPGTTYLATFSILPANGSSVVPALTMTTIGNGILKSSNLQTGLPAGATGVPYVIRFIANSATTTLRFTANGGFTATADQIDGLTVAEPFTPAPSTSPSPGQLAQIQRRYGMFIHFGLISYVDIDRVSGSHSPSLYQPTALDVEQWIQTAYEAGMRYVLLITKHHDGFCMWNSKWTNYDVASSPVPVDVVAAAAAACQKYGIKLGIYYSMSDHHEPSYSNDELYDQYLLRQVRELLENYGPICEFWFDGGWEKASSRWPVREIRDLVHRLQPDCLISVNWTVGLPSSIDSPAPLATMQEGYPIRYFPSDFRSADPYLARFPDPKRFSFNGQSFYLPFEATITLSGKDEWFIATGDETNKPVTDLARMYYSATAQDNLVVFNAPPDRSGRIRDLERNTLFQLRDRLGLTAGQHLPWNRSARAAATASSVWNNDTANFGPQHAMDGNPDTRWSCAGGLTTATIEINPPNSITFDRILIDEYETAPGVGSITAFRLQAWNGLTWTTFHIGTTCGRFSLHDFPRQTTTKVRLVIDSANSAPSIWEIQIQDAGHAFTSWRDQYFPEANSHPDFDPNGDPDHDGRSNIVEFALDDNPASRVDSGKTFTSNVFARKFFSITLPVRSGVGFTGQGPLTATADGVTWHVEAAADLGDFSAPLVEVIPALSAGRPALSPGWSYRSFRHTTPVSEMRKGFFRIGVTSSP